MSIGPVLIDLVMLEIPMVALLPRNDISGDASNRSKN